MRTVNPAPHVLSSKIEMLDFADDKINGIDEEVIKWVMERFLGRNGYQVAVGKQLEKGPDILAHKNNANLLIEAKGELQSRQARTNSFYNALGQICFRMSPQMVEYAIALPAHRDYAKLIHKLPDCTRQTIRLNFYLVDLATDQDEYLIEFLQWNVL